jgi:hypothetical protein
MQIAGTVCCGHDQSLRNHARQCVSASVRRAAAEGVPETVIAAIYLLHERGVDEIASKLRPDELGHVIRLVGRCPSCYPPRTLDALKSHRQVPSPEPVATTSRTHEAHRRAVRLCQARSRHSYRLERISAVESTSTSGLNIRQLTFLSSTAFLTALSRAERTDRPVLTQ